MSNENTGYRAIGCTSALIVMGIVVAAMSMFTINPGERGFTITRGNIHPDIYREGFYFKNPVTTSLVTMNVKTQKVEAVAVAASKDLQTVQTTIALNFSIKEGEVINLYKTVGNENAIDSVLIKPAIQEAVKSATAKFSAEELITKRQEVGDSIVNQLKIVLEPRGLIIEGINITNFEFSESFDQAIESKVRAEQDALAQKNKLEQVKYEAQQQIESAKAQAETIRIQAQAVQNQGGAEYVQMQWINKWNGQLPQYILGSNTTMLMGMPGQK